MPAAVVHRVRFNFMAEARIWYSGALPRDSSHPIPTDLQAAKALSSSPAALNLFTWLPYLCFTARGQERVPLFGEFGLLNQLGSIAYARPRKFREKLEGWLQLVRAMWPECPAHIDGDGTGLLIDRSIAVLLTRHPRKSRGPHAEI